MRSSKTLSLLALLAVACDGPTLPPMGDAGPPDAAAAEDGGAPAPVQWSACDPEALPPGYSIPDDVECAHLEVPVDHARPDGERLTIRVARHRARVEGALPVFQLAGGPGGSSVAQAGIVDRLMPRLRDRYDLVYVDQRGTGDSGYLGCPGGYPESREGWERCAIGHADRPLEHYLTVDAADDLDLVRERLGYDRILLRGGSYGTRLGIEYARRHGDRLVAMALDGADPPESDFFSQMTRNFDRGMRLLFEDCAADEDCAAVAPDLEASVDALIERADLDPRSVTVGGASYLEDRGLVLSALRYLVEAASWRFRLPRAVVDALDERYARWDALLSELFGVTVRHVDTAHAPPPVDGLAQDSYVAPGLYLVVVCAESLPNAPSVEELRALGDSQKYGDAHLGELAEACAVVDVPPLAAELRTPVVSDVPALVLSGELDINTIPEWGEQMASTLSRGRHVVVPAATHSVMVTPCGAGMIQDFLLAGGDHEAVDTRCLEGRRLRFE